MVSPLSPTETLEVVEAFVRALIEAPHTYECARKSHAASGECSCWRGEAVEVYDKYVQRVRDAAEAQVNKDTTQQGGQHDR